MSINHVYPVVPVAMHPILPAIVQIACAAVDQLTSQRDVLSDQFYDVMSAGGFDNPEFDDLVRLIAGHLNIEYTQHTFNPQNPGSFINDAAMEIGMWKKSLLLEQLPWDVKSMYSDLLATAKDNVAMLGRLKQAVANQNRPAFNTHQGSHHVPQGRPTSHVQQGRPGLMPSRQAGIIPAAADSARFQSRQPPQDSNKEVQELRRKIKELEEVAISHVNATLVIPGFKTLQAPKGGEMDRGKHRIKTVSAMIDVSPSKYQGYLRSVDEQITALKPGQDASRLMTDTHIVQVRRPVPSIAEACMDAQTVLEDEVAPSTVSKRYNVVISGYNIDSVEPSTANIKAIHGLLKHNTNIELLVENYPKIANMLPASVDADSREMLSVCLQAIDASLTSDINDYIRYGLGLSVVIGRISDWLDLIPYLRSMRDIDAETYISSLFTWTNIQLASILENGAWEYQDCVVVRKNVKVAALRITLDELGLEINPDEPTIVNDVATPVFHGFIRSLFDRDRHSVKSTGSIYISLRGSITLRAWRYLKEPGQFVVHRV